MRSPRSPQGFVNNSTIVTCTDLKKYKAVHVDLSAFSYGWSRTSMHNRDSQRAPNSHKDSKTASCIHRNTTCMVVGTPEGA